MFFILLYVISSFYHTGLKLYSKSFIFLRHSAYFKVNISFIIEWSHATYKLMCTNELLSILACEFCSGREYQLDKMRHINQLRTQFRGRIDVTKWISRYMVVRSLLLLLIFSIFLHVNNHCDQTFIQYSV